MAGATIREGAPDGDLIGHSTNLVGLSTPFLADVAFNARPVPVHISGVREMNGPLFEMLGLADDLAEAGDAFAAYMMAMFGIDREQREPGSATGRRRYRSSYLRLIKGWGYDSNGPEGAVLKGWVESRFGIFPTFHRERLVRQAPAAWAAYVAEKMSSRFHNNAIMAQLDLLYEFCQWALVRFAAPAETHLTLHRGVNDFDDHPIRARLDRRRVVMRLNSLSSFTAEREIADCFGDVILTARVPREKILFFNTLMTSHPLKGEGEYLVIGGDYELGVSR
ncbi:NAD(+)--dinitrogen-reductase ADP-D-ribosyltransferase [uncultured Pleomorphomonas sp.]|uniref:NAD(+)--dinitrogen-reductase ADP-D-ribosyltransferase n=1 Tax=uncultured Pleomorphomonas sp. TaxID=442121 RepID=A0A212LHX4_9HYPH|nr:NAD(+)--dinitrogen-reductase ADP-D-ribosyltransferase [uncultured Pleomorphomonas sp.]SCM77145.1 NAD(+)--dinitrogen-reductase ADP-D-ribosyltransferase [uncultured Pleomorphomonas sp.]